ncbi:ABC transporter ATP-binding protein [Sulfurimonas sp.]|jgi:phospholipid/cholesterol/gamma-HCH transport system ATP-binding protein|uniref:ABC transporter ATP-binding protein n=1 Tax=Sulfurimonas sp. TaxID=2022749 RepID=UPI0025D5DA0A|nr:ATP-binding cassette domain-containing protein [Sulfurimonas sp.]MBT5934496.1 ATP-binding cassette domain-containing protein [Sulfurimonas sp.]
MNIIEVRNLKTKFENKIVHDNISLTIKEGEIYGLLGPSGCGKTTLLREMVMLQEFSEGSIEVLGYDIYNINHVNAQKIRSKWGVLFQAGALFSSLSIKENIALPLIEYTDLSSSMIDEIVNFKINLVGLKSSDAHLFPSQISGGMKKKAALARALAMDPKLLFLDEPTSGLDPISARDFDRLILKLRSVLGLTIVMVSHDLQSIYDTLDRVAIIDNQKIAYEGTISEIGSVNSNFIQTFFKNKEHII